VKGAFVMNTSHNVAAERERNRQTGELTEAELALISAGICPAVSLHGSAVATSVNTNTVSQDNA